MSTNLTVQEAKQIAMQTERDIVAVIPAEYVASTEQAQEGVLLSCDNTRGYQWTGRTKIQLQGSPDVASLIDSVSKDFSQRPGYAAAQTQTGEGRPRSQIVGEYGAGYLFSAQEDTDRLEIASFSPCFILPEDQWAGDTY